MLTKQVDYFYKIFYTNTLNELKFLAFCIANNLDDCDEDLWNESISNPKYNSYYINGEPTINAFSLMGTEFKQDTFIIVIGTNNKLKYSWDGIGCESHFMSEAKGILFLNTKIFKHHIEAIRDNNITFIIEELI